MNQSQNGNHHPSHPGDSDLPVIIVGAGPVGLSLGMALARQNIRVEVYETLPELSTEARASTFHPRTLEVLAEWDVLNQVLAQGYVVDRLQYWERQTRQLVAEFDYHTIAGDTAYPFRLQCPQSTLTRILKPLLETRTHAAVHMGHTLTGYEDHGSHVTAHFTRADGTTHTVQGAYLCGADGSKSVVRQNMGVSFEGMTYEDRFLLIASDIDLSGLFADFAPVCYLFDPEEWVIVLHLPDVTRVVFRLRDDEDERTAQDEVAIRARMQKFIGEDLPYAIGGVSIYRVHQRVAETFHKGRTLILGDAAHINNPMGGMGMNSGIYDAYTLAPHLCDALRTGKSHGLQVWSAERRAFAVQDIQKHTDKNYRDMSARETLYRENRNTWLRQTANDPVLAREYLLKASMLGEKV